MLEWNFSAEPGNTLLHYTITAAADAIDSVTFYGTIGNQSIIGDSQIFAATTAVKTLEKIHWTICDRILEFNATDLPLKRFYPQQMF